MGRGSSTNARATMTGPRRALAGDGDGVAAARREVAQWLEQREAAKRPGQEWLAAVAEALLDGYAELNASWQQQTRRELRHARAALLHVEEKAAARAAELSGVPFSPYELAAASTAEQEEVWAGLLPAGVQLGELWQLTNLAGRAVQLPVSRPRR
jgi:hypothetical protein